MSSETIRERILKILLKSNKPLSVSELASILGINTREQSRIYSDLEHVAKSIFRNSRGRYRLAMIPPVCRKCSYVFKDLDKPRKPSKCPRCKSMRISEPLFQIIEK